VWRWNDDDREFSDHQVEGWTGCRWRNGNSQLGPPQLFDAGLCRPVVKGVGRTDLRALSPLIWEHVNPYGFDLDMSIRLPVK
jgi:hypothetical protein